MCARVSDNSINNQIQPLKPSHHPQIKLRISCDDDDILAVDFKTCACAHLHGKETNAAECDGDKNILIYIIYNVLYKQMYKYTSRTHARKIVTVNLKCLVNIIRNYA